eukprot:6255119-Prorocentrum_lima.AAC.1
MSISGTPTVRQSMETPRPWPPPPARHAGGHHSIASRTREFRAVLHRIRAHGMPHAFTFSGVLVPVFWGCASDENLRAMLEAIQEFDEVAGVVGQARDWARRLGIHSPARA